MGLRWHLVLANGLLLACGGVLVFFTLDQEGQVRPLVWAGFTAVFALVFALATGRLWRAWLDNLKTSFEKERSATDWPPLPYQWLAPQELEHLHQALGASRQVEAKYQRQLARDRELQESILNSVTSGLMAVDAKGKVILANEALGRLFGGNLPLEGRRSVEVVRNSAVEEVLAQVLAEGEAQTIEVALNRGGERIFDVHVAPLRQGNVCTGAVSVFYDITALRVLERIRKDFVANVSHELRTPLTAIKGCAETLADGALEDRGTAERFIEVIGNHSDRLTRLLDDLLNLSRLESDHQKIETEACNLRQLVYACIGAVGPAAHKKEIEIRAQGPEDMTVFGDRKLLEQALINLLDNGIKYTPENGAVKVCWHLWEPETKRMGGCPRHQIATAADLRPRAVLEVSDDGIGIPSEDLDRIFERFYRVDKGRSRALGGTGLGLSIVRHIVEAHGEGLYIESELGKGSSFGLTLALEPTSQVVDKL